MNLTNKALLLTAGILSSSMVFASTAGVSLTNDLVKADVAIDAGPFSISGGGTHDADNETSSAYVGINIQDSDTSGPLQIGLGVRIYALDNNMQGKNDEIAVATALGGWYRYTFPMANRLSFYASGYYAPTVLSVSRLDHMYTYDVRGEYMTTQNTRAYIGYGSTVSVYTNGERRETSDGLSIGASVAF
ncbi:MULTISPECIES: YfaZ family outer membrane protein [Marinomonas]|uniref:YfaZ family outer membrane protein n=1 Tax=Marinomonas TaxID=28253 RepID=UPI001055E07B|nr:YfaZ family outer membrane protein [Marinomonas flavescens]